MTSMVLMDSTLASLTPSVNAPLGGKGGFGVGEVELSVGPNLVKPVVHGFMECWVVLTFFFS
jgi:hypothetical protein